MTRAWTFSFSKRRENDLVCLQQKLNVQQGIKNVKNGAVHFYGAQMLRRLGIIGKSIYSHHSYSLLFESKCTTTVENSPCLTNNYFNI